MSRSRNMANVCSSVKSERHSVVAAAMSALLLAAVLLIMPASALADAGKPAGSSGASGATSHGLVAAGVEDTSSNIGANQDAVSNERNGEDDADDTFTKVRKPKVQRAKISVRARMKLSDWQSPVSNGKVAGAKENVQLVGLRIALDKKNVSGSIAYRVHTQKDGWLAPSRDGKVAGAGASRHIDGIKVRLTGGVAKLYDVYYRVRSSQVGWLDWTKNNSYAGTKQSSSYLTAVRVKLVKKGAASPKPTAMPSARGRWGVLEAKYHNKSSVNQLLEVKYTGDSSARVVLRTKRVGKAGNTWKTALACGGYVGREGIGQASMYSTRTPQGDFGLTKAFGILDDPGAKLEYVKVTNAMYWCGDEHYYNQLINIYEKPHWCAGEHLIDYWPHYNYGLFMDYNTNPIRYGAGAAFFVHCTGSTPYTGGCVAVSEPDMVKIIRTVSHGARLCIFPR